MLQVSDSELQLDRDVAGAAAGTVRSRLVPEGSGRQRRRRRRRAVKASLSSVHRGEDGALDPRPRPKHRLDIEADCEVLARAAESVEFKRLRLRLRLRLQLRLWAASFIPLISNIFFTAVFGMETVTYEEVSKRVSFKQFSIATFFSHLISKYNGRRSAT